jgi:hypothetical protein
MNTHATRFDPKAFATLQARCALSGVTLIPSQDDRGQPTAIATRWALTREFHSLQDVETWLANVTGYAG